MTAYFKKKSAMLDAPPTETISEVTREVKQHQTNDIDATEVIPPDTAVEGGDPDGKVRLSCDISRRNHKKVRVAAADRYTSIAQVVDDLIERNL